MSVSLRAQMRRDDDASRNLFVRLSSATAQRLVLESSTPRSTNVSEAIEFLPLVITIDDFRIYCSYNGGTIGQDDSISIPQKLLPSTCDIVDNVSLEVGVLDDVQVAERVEVEPLTVEAWELLQIHAAALEEHGWLEQVSVVYQRQVIPLRVSNNDVSHVKVVAMSSPQEGELGYAKLMERTEISIRPKPRRLQFPSVSLRILPIWEDWSVQMQRLAQQESLDRLQVPSVSAALVHPTTLACVDGLLDGDLVTVQSTSRPAGLRLRLYPSDMIPKKNIAMSRSVRLRLGVTPLRNTVLIGAVAEGFVDSASGLGHEETSPYAELADVSIPDISTSMYRQTCQWTEADGLSSSPIVWDGHLQLLPAVYHCFESSFHKVISCFAASEIDEFEVTCLFGPKGSGKTHWSLLLAAIMRIRRFHSTTYLDCHKLRSGSTTKLSAIIDELIRSFQEAAASSSAVVILDDLDAMVPEMEPTVGSDSSVQQQPMNPVLFQQSKVFADTLRMLLEESASSVHVVVTGETKGFIQRFRPSSHAVKFLELPTLYKYDRGHLLESMLIHRKLDIERQHVSELAKRTDGHRPLDLDHVVRRLSAISRSAELTSDDFVSVLDQFIPLSRQGLIEHNLSSCARWNEDVGGLFEAKKELTTAVLRPIRYKRIYENLPTRLPRGILLYGPPGVGKSFLIPPLAAECGLALVTCHGPELLDRYIGASEAKVRQLFARAQAAAPSLLFLDEFDALAPRRGTDTTGVTDRVVNQLLTFLDGVENTANEHGRPVYVVAASARPERIDPALLRPGRLEKHVYIGYPETKEEWSEVLEKAAGSSYLLEEEALVAIRNGELFDATNYAMTLSPADLCGALGSAHLEAVHEAIRMGVSTQNDHRELRVKLAHLKKALGETRPSLADSDRKALEANYVRFRTGTSPASTQFDRLKTALK